MTRYRNAVVTGASSGIGAEVAKYLASNRCHVLAIARNNQNLLKQKLSLKKQYQKYFHTMQADINESNIHSTIIKEALKFGPIDLFISNAGVGVSKSFLEMTDEDIEQVINTNLRSSIRITKKVIDQNQKNKEQSKLQIVFVTSLAGKMGFPNLSIYSATKFGVEGFAEALRHDLKDTNVSICILRPGVTDTGFFESAGMEEFRASVEGKSILHSPESVAVTLFERLSPVLEELTVGNDRYVIKLLPFVGWRKRLKILDIVNKF